MKLFIVEGNDVWGDSPYMFFVGIFDTEGLKALIEEYEIKKSSGVFHGCAVEGAVFFDDIKVSVHTINQCADDAGMSQWLSQEGWDAMIAEGGQ